MFENKEIKNLMIDHNLKVLDLQIIFNVTPGQVRFWLKGDRDATSGAVGKLTKLLLKYPQLIEVVKEL